MPRVLTSIAIPMLLIVLVPAPRASAQVTPGLVAHYTMDDGNVPPNNECPVVTVAADGKPLPGSGAVLQCNWDGVVPWNDKAATLGAQWDPQISGPWFFQATYRLDANVDRSLGAKTGRWAINSPNGSDHLFLEIDNRAGRDAVLKAQVGESVFWGETDRGYAAYVNRGPFVVSVFGGNGQISLFHNGRLLMSWTGLGPLGSELSLMSNWSDNGVDWQHDAVNYVYIDDVWLISQERGGDLAAMMKGTAARATAPGPPPPFAVVRTDSCAFQSPPQWPAASAGRRRSRSPRVRSAR